jgi:hypothetical protein
MALETAVEGTDTAARTTKSSNGRGNRRNRQLLTGKTYAESTRPIIHIPARCAAVRGHRAIGLTQSNADKKNGPGGESGNQRPKRRKDKLIRLDDLIPKQDVTGGRQLPFGVNDTTNNP